MGLNRRDEREGYGRLDDGEDDYLVCHILLPNKGATPLEAMLSADAELGLAVLQPEYGYRTYRLPLRVIL